MTDLTPDLDQAALVERLCGRMHDAARQEGWVTQEASRKPWSDVPAANRRTMRRSVDAVLSLLDNEGRLCEPGEITELLDVIDELRTNLAVAARESDLAYRRTKIVGTVVGVISLIGLTAVVGVFLWAAITLINHA